MREPIAHRDRLFQQRDVRSAGAVAVRHGECSARGGIVGIREERRERAFVDGDEIAGVRALEARDEVRIQAADLRRTDRDRRCVVGEVFREAVLQAGEPRVQGHELAAFRARQAGAGAKARREPEVGELPLCAGVRRPARRGVADERIDLGPRRHLRDKGRFVGVAVLRSVADGFLGRDIDQELGGRGVVVQVGGDLLERFDGVREGARATRARQRRDASIGARDLALAPGGDLGGREMPTDRERNRGRHGGSGRYARTARGLCRDEGRAEQRAGEARVELTHA